MTKKRTNEILRTTPNDASKIPIKAHASREEVLETLRYLTVPVVIFSVVGNVGLQRGTAASSPDRTLRQPSVIMRSRAPTSTRQPALWYDNRNPPSQPGQIRRQGGQENATQYCRSPPCCRSRRVGVAATVQDDIPSRKRSDTCTATTPAHQQTVGGRKIGKIP